uniref:Secreted protein n=1 Tax=Trichogramma kaykai TaxID=54128 RepID=A0ABD2XIR6_9HYME
MYNNRTRSAATYYTAASLLAFITRAPQQEPSVSRWLQSKICIFYNIIIYEKFDNESRIIFMYPAYTRGPSEPAAVYLSHTHISAFSKNLEIQC